MQNTVKSIVSWVRSFLSLWRGGIACRVAIIMSLAILLVSVFISAFLLWEGSRFRESDIRGRSLISYRIVQNHGGRIEVESEVGRGARFRIILPSHEHRAVKG